MQILSGVLLPLVLMGAGVWLAVLLWRYLLCRPRRVWQALRGQGGKSAARAMAVALAGTLGVGNIAGVATAIALGGAGAVFWMWLSALLAMLLKYAEIVLAVRTRRTDAKGIFHGGAMYYIKEAFKGRAGRVLAAAFALLCLLCAVTLGGVIQSSAAAEAASVAFRLPPVLTGVLMGLLAVAVLQKGGTRIERACTALVPLVCAVFTAAAAAVLILRHDCIPAAFSAVFTGAFSFQSGSAGVAGFFTAKCVRYGVTRGLISNEAGCGTAPIAHAHSDKPPAAQGIWGILEVFVDTVLLCTLTALVILVSGVPLTGEGIALALDAFSAVLGDAAPPVMAVSVLFFAFATVLCWSHYGGECLRYLTGKPAAEKWMLPVTLCACVLGAVAAPAFLWELTDLVVTLMALLNVTVLLVCRRTVLQETRAYFAAPQDQKAKKEPPF